MIEKIKPETTDRILDLLPKASKGAAILGTFCGFFYLLAYTRDAGIPFPLQLNVLPLSLLVIGLCAFGGVAILAGGVMIPAVFVDTTLEVAKEYLIAREVVAGRPWIRILRWIYCFMMPLLLVLGGFTVWLTSTKTSPSWIFWVGWGLVASGGSWILGTAILVPSLKAKWVRYLAFTSFQTLLAAWAYGVLILLIVAIAPSVEKWPVLQGSLVAAIIFCPVYFLVTFPSAGPSAIILLPPNFEYKTPTPTLVAFALAIFVAFLSIINYPINAKIGGSVLRIFGIGGRVPMIVCLKNSLNFVPPPYVDLDEKKCSSELLVLFDGGDRLYVAVRKAGEADDKNSQAIPLYIPQEAIAFKLYPSKRWSP